MLRRWKLWLLAALAVGGVYAAWRLGWIGEQASGTEHLVNQVWIERMPRDGRDLVHHLVLVDRDGQRIGVVGRSSRWRVGLDLFLWGLDRNLLRTRFPQEEKRLAFRVRTWHCAGEAPRPLDLCLELTRDGRNARFYSRKDWVVRPRGEEAALPGEIAWAEPGVDLLERGLGGAGSETLGEGPEAPAGLGPFEHP